MKKKNLVVFDIDGTLVDSVSIHQKGFVQALKQMGVQSIDSNFKTYRHHTDSYIAKEIYEKDKKEEFSSAMLERFETLLYDFMKEHAFSPIIGAKVLVDQIDNKTDFAVAYATGSLLRPAQLKLESIGLNVRNACLVASNQIEDREGIVSEAITRAEILHETKFKRVISVGDGLWDLKAAGNLNLEFRGVGEKNKEVLIRNGMKYHSIDFQGVDVEAWLSMLT